MDYKAQTQPIFMNTAMGLQRVFEFIKKTKNTDTITLQDIQNPGNISPYDSPFIQILQQNFQGMDANSDKSISADEMNKVITGIDQQGLTFEQLNILASQNSLNMKQEVIEKILNNFKKIDENGDGKVNKAELDKYFVSKEIDEKKEELNAIKDSNYTMFYTTTTTNADGTESSDSSESIDLSYE